MIFLFRLQIADQTQVVQEQTPQAASPWPLFPLICAYLFLLMLFILYVHVEFCQQTNAKAVLSAGLGGAFCSSAIASWSHGTFFTRVFLPAESLVSP
jgi:uncharacterized membrane protein